jgi:uncharacterized protein (DUF58 family)
MRARLTPIGWLVLGEAAVLLSSRFWPARSIPEPTTIALGFAMLAAVAAAWWLAPRQLQGVEAQWLISPRVPAGEEIAVGALLGTRRSLPPCTIDAFDPVRRKLVQAVRLRALGCGSVRPSWSARFPRRGVFQLPPLRLRTAQPFGVVEVVHDLGAGCEVVVLPPVGQLRRALRDRLDAWLSELTPTTDTGSDEIDRLRDYRPGDPLRAVHWRASARHATLLVAERRDPACRRLAVVLDTSTSGPTAIDGRRFEQLVVATASLAAACLQRGWQVTVHGGFAQGGISGDLPHLLEGLALAGQDGTPVADCMPSQTAVAVLTSRPADVPRGERPPLVLPLADLDDLFRLPARVRVA